MFEDKDVVIDGMQMWLLRYGYNEYFDIIENHRDSDLVTIGMVLRENGMAFEMFQMCVEAGYRELGKLQMLMEEEEQNQINN